MQNGGGVVQGAEWQTQIKILLFLNSCFSCSIVFVPNGLFTVTGLYMEHIAAELSFVFSCDEHLRWQSHVAFLWRSTAPTQPHDPISPVRWNDPVLCQRVKLLRNTSCLKPSLVCLDILHLSLLKTVRLV